MHILVAVPGAPGEQLADSIRAQLPETRVSWTTDFEEMLLAAQSTTWDAAVTSSDFLSGSYQSALRVLRSGITIVIVAPDRLETLNGDLTEETEDIVVTSTPATAGREVIARIRMRLAARSRGEHITARRRLVAETPGIVSYALDAEGHFTEILGDTSMLGRPSAELLGRHFSGILDARCVARVSRNAVLPSLEGESTGPHGAPGLFDERRRGRRKTRGLEITLRPVDGASPVRAIVSAEGEVEHTMESGVRVTGTAGVIRATEYAGDRPSGYRVRPEESYDIRLFLNAYSDAPQMMNEILLLFSAEGPARLAELKGAVARGDQKEARRLAQSLATTTGTLLHEGAAVAARDLDVALRSRNPRAREDALNRLDARVGEIIAAIRSLRLRSPDELN